MQSSLLSTLWPKANGTSGDQKLVEKPFAMFIPILSIIVKTWKQLKCPSGAEWRNKLCYIQTHGILFQH